MKNTCIIIVGPTAVGKTALAIRLAAYFSTEIISADSRQCYKELNIGVAKPSNEELESVPHHFINSHSIHEEVNAAIFEQYALGKIKTLLKKNKIAVMVGGTGLYIKAFCEGMDEMPVTEPIVRKMVLENYEQKGFDWLQDEVKKMDALFFANGENKNPQRLMRALEIKLSTGKSILDFRTNTKKERDFNVIKIGLEMPREKLYQNINKRVDIMMNDGLLDEAKFVFQYKHLNALQTVGYKELFDFFEGKISVEKAVNLIKQNSRNYAKRQITWFKKDSAIQWFDMNEENVFDRILDFLSTINVHQR